MRRTTDPRQIVLAAIAALLLAVPSAVGADTSCGNGDWSDETHASQGGDSGLGGTGVAGDDSGIGGTGGTGDDSGVGGTGVFGVITALGSICVNGAWIQVPSDVEVVFENGVAIGAESLAVGQTVWLVAQDGEEGLETSRVWVMPRTIALRDASAWLERRLLQTRDFTRLSVEGPVGRWLDRGGFEVHGVVVQAREGRALRGALEAAPRVRVTGRLGRDGVVRPDRIQVPKRPPVRPQRPSVRPPKIERAPVDRPIRPDTVIRRNETDRTTTP